MTDKPSTEHTEKEEKIAICTLLVDNVKTDILRDKRGRLYGKNKYGMVRWDSIEGQAMIEERVANKLKEAEGQETDNPVQVQDKKDSNGWLW